MLKVHTLKIKKVLLRQKPIWGIKLGKENGVMFDDDVSSCSLLCMMFWVRQLELR